MICAYVCAFAAGFIYILMSPSLRVTGIITLISAAAVFLLVLILLFVLEGRPAKVRIPVFIFAGFAALTAVLSVVTYRIGYGIVFRPRFNDDAYDKLEERIPEVQKLSLDGLSGWRIPASDIHGNDPRPVILYFGGRGEDSSYRILEILEDENASFLYEDCDFIYLDYPSYGRSKGDLTEDTLKEFSVDAYEAVDELPTTGSVVVIGYSLGTGPAVYLASRKEANPGRIILVSPYYSGYDVFNGALNIFHGPLKLLVSFKMPVHEYAHDVTCPVTIIASDSDDVIPIDASKRLFAEFTQAATDFITVPGTEHNDMMSSAVALGAIENSLEGI